jgi:hypothetical protein
LILHAAKRMALKMLSNDLQVFVHSSINTHVIIQASLQTVYMLR